MAAAADAKKLSDAALCLIWVNHDCEIATLDEKYLRLSGAMDPTTHDWHVKDHAKLDALLQMAEIGARHGIAFAVKAGIDPSILAMIYERAAHGRLQDDDASALDSLRNYWRCALLGNVCWQLAHIPKAQPVDLGTVAPAKDGKKADAGTTSSDKTNQANSSEPAPGPATSTNTVVRVSAPTAQATTNEIVTPVPPAPTAVAVVPPPVIPVAPIATNELVNVAPPPNYGDPAPVNPPVAPIATNEDNIPVAPIATNMESEPAPPPAPPVNAPSASPVPTPPPAPAATAGDEAQIPVAPIAKVEDYTAPSAAPATNSAPSSAALPITKPDNADGHSGSFP